MNQIIKALAQQEHHDDHDKKNIHGFKGLMCSPANTPINPFLSSNNTESKRDYLILNGFGLDPIHTPNSYWIVSSLICISLACGFVLLIYLL